MIFILFSLCLFFFRLLRRMSSGIFFRSFHLSHSTSFHLSHSMTLTLAHFSIPSFFLSQKTHKSLQNYRFFLKYTNFFHKKAHFCRFCKADFTNPATHPNPQTYDPTTRLIHTKYEPNACHFHRTTRPPP